MAIKIGLLNDLALFIRDNVLDEQFNMAEYRGTYSDEEAVDLARTFDDVVIDTDGLYCVDVDVEDVRNQHNCGTVGCALGWAPVAHQELHKDSRYWQEVAEQYGVNPGTGVWDWLFSPSWARTDHNTRLSFVERVDLLGKNLDLDDVVYYQATRAAEHEDYEQQEALAISMQRYEQDS